MNTEQEMQDGLRAAYSADSAWAGGVDLWPRVSSQAQARGRTSIISLKRHRRIGAPLLAAALALTIAAGTIAVAVASTNVRNRVSSIGQTAAAVVGFRVPSQHAAPVPMPSPGFHILEPTYVPGSLTVRETSYNPGPSATGQSQWTGTVTQGGPPPSTPLRVPNGVSVPTVISRFSSPTSTAYVLVTQHAATAANQPTPGTRIELGSNAAYVSDGGGITTVVVTNSGTAVQISTNMGRDEAIAVAASLR